MSQATYTNPPIVEAIVDFKIRLKKPFEIDKLKHYASRFSEKFPTQSFVQLFKLNIGPVSSDGNVAKEGGPPPVDVGVRLTNGKNDRVLQLQQGSFTLSHLAPYTSWEVLRDEAKVLWDDLALNYEPFVVTRCALRFINRIVIPKASIELSDYFNLYPQIPKGIPQDISGMLLQLQMPQTDLDASVAVVNLALAESDKPTNTSVVLDIDLFSPLVDVEPTSEKLWETLELYRNRKNDLFETFITDRTRELFK